MSPPKCPRYFEEAAGGRSGEQLRTDDLQLALQYITTLSGGGRATYEIWDREEQRVAWVVSRGYVGPPAWWQAAARWRGRTSCCSPTRRRRAGAAAPAEAHRGETSSIDTCPTRP